MGNAKDDVQTVLSNLPDDCTLEDVQYHLYVVTKIQRGTTRAEEEGTRAQQEVEDAFKKRTA